MSWFCKHKWFEKERHYGRNYRIFDNVDCGDAIMIIQECEKCGKIKKITIP